MSFTCKNGPQHSHETVDQAKACWGFTSATRSPSYPATVTHPPVVEYATQRQLDYIADLNGDTVFAAKLTKSDASGYIDRLKKEKARQSRMDAATRKPSADPRLELLKGMIDMVPDGYFAVQKQEGSEVTFLRISRPKKKNFAGSIKIQTQHGPRLEVAAAYWPGTKTFSVYRHGVVEPLLLLVSDYKSAALRYARVIGKCCRCNSPLTDTRSRHYGIGPECEDHWPWVIEEVDAGLALGL